ncbi:MAG: GMC family oxidoreductase [Deltaproteobacteria bacterium]|nr:MAG: GMC family oxidoreductase [Deltaproteobacteria bacterium]
MSGVVTGASITQDVTLVCDVVIVGSGAGGAVLAAGLAARGVDVIVLEAGGAYTSADFDLDEGKAYAAMYQDCGTQSTDDLSIALLQGRSLGGSTTINWTTCYRTPARILAHWQKTHGLDQLTAEVLNPHWDAVEERLHITEWPEAMVNANNETILRGGRKLGWDVHTLKRNVNGCANSGYCGVGCPVNGKQAMHRTYIPDALAHGAGVYADISVERITWSGRRATGVDAVVLDRATNKPTGVKVRVDAKVVVSSAGALHGPALLLRSGLDGEGHVGKRTFIHPVCAVTGEYAHSIKPWSGAPQSAACHEFVDRGPDKIGFFIEAPPMQPMLGATGPKAFGTDMAMFMGQLEHASTLIALAVDGIHPEDPGGTVTLRPDGRPKLHYPTRPLLVEALREAHLRMAELHVAAGATRLTTLHAEPIAMMPDEIGRLADLPYGAHEHTMFSAHLMGGCGLGTVIDQEHRYKGLDNVFVVDGSALPTALGVNPSQTIYGLASRAVESISNAV